MNNESTKIHLWDAISEMRRLSNLEREFSFSFVKYNRQNHAGGDLARISRARLRAKTPESVIAHSSYKLFFVDLDSGKALNCWQVLITEFNGQKIYL